MPINIAWGPVASVPANQLVTTSALNCDPTDAHVAASADLAAQAAGIGFDVRIEYRKSSADTFREIAGTTGTTIGGPDHDRHGNVIETGLRTDIPDVGVSGRQLRAAIQVTATMTNVSGHVSTT